MLKVMRENSQSLIIYIIFGVLVLVFALSFGGGGGGFGSGGTGDFAATVNGEGIRRQEFAVQYNQRIEQYRKFGLFGGNFDPETMGVRDQVIDGLIENKLLTQEAESRGLVATNKELLASLKSDVGLDQITYARFEQWVQQTHGISTQEFEEDYRRYLGGQKLKKLVTDNVQIGDSELKATFLRENDRAKVTFVRFNSKAEDTKSTDAEIAAVVADELPEIQKYYDANMLKFRQPKMVKARQILKKVARDASPEDVKKATDELMALRAKIEAGGDFAALAKEHSEDANSKDKGGDMGMIKRGQMTSKIVDPVFALKTDAMIVEPIRTPQGLHLIQAVEINPPSTKEIEEVKTEIATTLLAERADEKATLAEAEAFLAQLQGGADLEELTWSRDEEKEAKDKAKEEDKTLSDTKNVRAETPWVLKTAKSIPGIGENEELIKTIFSLSLENSLASKPYKLGRFVYVVKLSERETPDLKVFEESKDSLRDSAQLKKSEMVYRDWVKHLRDNAEVILNPEVFPKKITVASGPQMG